MLKHLRGNASVGEKFNSFEQLKKNTLLIDVETGFLYKVKSDPVTKQIFIADLFLWEHGDHNFVELIDFTNIYVYVG